MRIVDRFRDLVKLNQDRRGIRTWQLRDKLDSHAKQMVEEVILADCQVSSERLEALSRLARLVELCEAAESRQIERNGRW